MMDGVSKSTRLLNSVARGESSCAVNMVLRTLALNAVDQASGEIADMGSTVADVFGTRITPARESR